ncbi:hypothetical protein OAF33_01985 [bacterium]|nr:hypothetical protein [bacterium]
MKILFTILLLSSSILSAEEVKLPAFEKSLGSELFFNKGEISVGHTYGFATDKKLDALKPMLLKFLGKGWRMEIAPEEALKNMPSEDGMQFVGLARLLHKDMTEHEVGITLVKMPPASDKALKKYSYMLSITTANKAKIEKQKSTK